MKITSTLYLLLLMLFLHGCSIFPKEQDETKGWSAQKFYTEAKKALNSSDYENAIRYYELLDSRYPFGRFASQGQIDTAYAYYKFDEPESAIAAADRFIKLHPNHPHVDYVYYLKGLIYFNRNIGILARIFQQQGASRDPASARQAFIEFSTLVKKFPKSRYAHDSLLRARYLRNNLGMHEIHVAQYYMRRGAYVAVVNRCKYVIENFDRSIAVPDALDLMAQAYDKLGLKKLAIDARRVLTASYPGAVSHKAKKSWWNPF